MILRPDIEFKSIDGDALGSNRNFGEMRSYYLIEVVAVHAEIAGRHHDADEARLRFVRSPHPNSLHCR
jgi:hypothetical protein